MEDFRQEVERMGAFAAKETISALSMYADDCKDDPSFVSGVVQLLSNRIRQVSAREKLPLIFLMDSIVKNVRDPFMDAFAPHVNGMFQVAVDTLAPQDLSRLERVLGTWRANDIFTDLIPALERLVARTAAESPLQPPSIPSSTAVGEGGMEPPMKRRRVAGYPAESAPMYADPRFHNPYNSWPGVSPQQHWYPPPPPPPPPGSGYPMMANPADPYGAAAYSYRGEPHMDPYAGYHYDVPASRERAGYEPERAEVPGPTSAAQGRTSSEANHHPDQQYHRPHGTMASTSSSSSAGNAPAAGGAQKSSLISRLQGILRKKGEAQRQQQQVQGVADDKPPASAQPLLSHLDTFVAELLESRGGGGGGGSGEALDPFVISREVVKFDVSTANALSRMLAEVRKQPDAFPTPPGHADATVRHVLQRLAPLWPQITNRGTASAAPTSVAAAGNGLALHTPISALSAADRTAIGQAAVRQLYDEHPNQSRLTGVRFKSMPALQEHEASVRLQEQQDLERKEGKGFFSREWFPMAGLWLQTPAESMISYRQEFLDVQRENHVGDDQGSERDDEDMSSSDDESDYVVPVRMGPNQCVICKDPFKTRFDEVAQTFVYVGAVEMGGALYHPVCWSRGVGYSDSPVKEEEEEEQANSSQEPASMGKSDDAAPAAKRGEMKVKSEPR